MSRRAPPPGRLMRLSDGMYRALLGAYPHAFRQVFGAHMAQAFHEQGRRAQRERGALGLLQLWSWLLPDLAATALQEHLSQEGHMSRSTFVRVAGAAALLGGALSALSDLSHPQGLARAVVPLSVACLLLGIVGLHALLWGREGRLGLFGFVLVSIGLALGFIGMAGSALEIVYPNPLAPIINTGEHAGLVFVGAGMLAWGFVTLRRQALGRWSILPLLIGLLSLTGIVFLIPAAFSALEHSPMPLIFSITWILFGLALLTRRTGPAPSAAPVGTA
jgi:hypothetical protein